MVAAGFTYVKRCVSFIHCFLCALKNTLKSSSCWHELTHDNTSWIHNARVSTKQGLPQKLYWEIYPFSKKPIFFVGFSFWNNIHMPAGCLGWIRIWIFPTPILYTISPTCCTISTLGGIIDGTLNSIMLWLVNLPPQTQPRQKYGLING